MRRTLILTGLIVIAMIAVAWATTRRQTVASTEVPAISPHEIMLKQSGNLPVDHWADPF